MVILRKAAVASFLLIGACGVGEVPGGGTDAGGAGAQTFDTMIKPLVMECATPACHGGVQPPVLTSFGALTAKYKMKPGNTNILVTKGNLTAGMHSGLPYLTAAEQTTVASWIDSL